MAIDTLAVAESRRHRPRICTWPPVGLLRKTAASTVSNVTYNKDLVRARSFSARAAKTVVRTSSVKKKLQVPDAPFTPSMIDDHTSIRPRPILVQSIETRMVLQGLQCLHRFCKLAMTGFAARLQPSSTAAASSHCFAGVTASLILDRCAGMRQSQSGPGSSYKPGQNAFPRGHCLQQ